MEDFNWTDMMARMQEIRLFASLHIRGKRQGATSPQEVDLLSRIIFSDAPPTPLDLATWMGLSKPAVSRLIDNLEKKEFLFKEYNQKDRRSYRLYTTEKGKLELELAYHHYLEPIYKLRRTIGEERFFSLTTQIREANRSLQSKEEKK